VTTVYKWAMKALYLFMACGTFAWWALLLGVCSFPTVADDHYSVAYNCHGKIVYTTRAESFFIHWFVPVMIVLVLILRYVQRRFQLPREV
jgi:hypothetical protein